LKGARIELQEMPAWNLEPPMTPSPEPLSSAFSSAEGEPVAPAAVVVPVDADKADAGALRTYLLAWARAHGEEYRYLFGPAAFARLADDLNQEFIIHRKRSSQP
jgi:hypothetical protein